MDHEITHFTPPTSTVGPRAAILSGKPTAGTSVGPARRFLTAGAAGALLLPPIAWTLVGAEPAAVGLALLAYLSAVTLCAAAVARSHPHGKLGWGNLATLSRLVLTMALLAPVVVPGNTAAILTVAMLALCLDGVDGWLARRQGQESDFGARFDMEVDALLGLILALNAWAAGTVGPVVLLLGLPRYLFVAAGLRWSWIARPLPERFGRKTVCVVQICALVALQLPVLAGVPAAAIVGLTLAALAWSFARDLHWLWRAQP